MRIKPLIYLLYLKKNNIYIYLIKYFFFLFRGHLNIKDRGAVSLQCIAIRSEQFEKRLFHKPTTYEPNV